MQTVFENTYIDDIEKTAEINRKIHDPKRYPLGWVLIGYALLVAILMVWWGNWIWSSVVALLAGYGIYNLNYHRIWAKWLLRKIKKENNDQIPPATITVTDKIDWQYKSTTISFPLSKLEKAYFLKHSIRIISQDGAFMTFQNTGFTKGSPEELEKFLRVNCPQAQIIHKR